ncbi:MAG: aldo/keto reductase [Acidobacteria bacterium]|nr:aldo/keto reductase [Acidobacteriota bacterium]
MKYMNLGRSGLQVSRICLGCMSFGSKKWREWVIEEEDSRPVIKKALELGINFFDTANMYSVGVSEEITGRALKDFARRSEIVLATKVYFPMNELPNQGGLSRKHIFEALDASLKRLGTDYVDLYQIHRWDYNTPIEETMEALNDLVRMGKVRYIGASSMFAWQMAKAVYTAKNHSWANFVSMQNHYNLVYREEEREMLPLCREEGIGVIPWSPLARGVLSGNRTKDGQTKTLRGEKDDFSTKLYNLPVDFDIAERLAQIAANKGVTSVQLALAWLLSKPAVTSPIIGTSKPAQLEDAIKSVDIKVSEEEQKSLEELYQPHAVLGHV